MAYFLQQWGFHTWEQAARSPIGIDAVERASGSAVAALDGSFFRVRFDRLTPKEKRYLRTARWPSSDQAHTAPATSRRATQPTSRRWRRRVSPLIAKGMIWSPNRGDTAFTVPMFDEFMKRILPGADWRHG
jgi:hypothetical protein